MLQLCIGWQSNLTNQLLDLTLYVHHKEGVHSLQGVNLALASQQGSFVAVDLGHSLVASDGSLEAGEQWRLAVPASARLPSSAVLCPTDPNMQDVVSQLELHCEEAGERTQPVCIVVESVSVSAIVQPNGLQGATEDPTGMAAAGHQPNVLQ